MGEVKREEQIPGPPTGPERVPPPLGPDAQKGDCVTSQIQHKLLWVLGCLRPSPYAFLSSHVGVGEEGSWMGAQCHPLDCPLPVLETRDLKLRLVPDFPGDAARR